ncbi:MAG: DUF1015 domain-containing protein [Candidatus Dormibacteria bacterium]
MATVSPLRGLRYNPEHVSLGAVLAPPYDVISEGAREALYARDLRNIVRVDYGRPEPGDLPGALDRYVRAAQHLDGWLRLGILVRDPAPCVYISDHEFRGTDGAPRRRRGVYLTVPARPWEQAEVLPHERTLRGPKQDRLALMRSTRTQTSAVWALWDQAEGIDAALETATRQPHTLAGTVEGELGGEQHRLWAVPDPEVIAAVRASLAGARLYIADGHHRYETAVAYAQEWGAGHPEQQDDAARVLLYLSAADDPSLEILPTHRLVSPGPGIPGTLLELSERLPPGASLTPAPSLEQAARATSGGGPGTHRFAVQAADGAALLTLPRTGGAGRAGLDVVVLQDAVLRDACGITPERIADGALTYTRSLAEAEARVRQGAAALGFGLRSCSTADLIGVSDAGETMPQKSTYFYPKVPTGLVLAPL